MAQLLQFPVLLKRGTGNVSQCIQRRQFSRILPLLAAPPKQQPLPKQSLGPMMNRNDMLAQGPGADRDDYGLFPKTFIMPTGSNRPDFWSKDMLTLMTRRIKTKAIDLASIIYYKWVIIKTPRPIIRFRATRSVAIGLHRQLYQAFAAGDTTTIKEICGEGLRETMIARIHNRKPGEKLKWEMVEEGKSRVVSHRATQLTVANTGMRQAVVRIKSTQKLTRTNASGKVIGGSGKKKEVTEYVVIQKKSYLGMEFPWKIWGTTDETTMTDLDREE